MAAVTAPSGRRPLIGKLAGLAARTPAMRRRAAAFMAGLKEHLTAVAALAAMDFGGFTVWHHGGWFVLAASLLLLQVELG